MAVSSTQSHTTEASSSLGSGLVMRLGLRFGVVAGLACAFWMVGLQMTGNNGFGPKQILAQLLVPLAAVASEWLLRRKLQPTKPGLGRSLGVGMLTVLFAALISTVSLIGLAHGAGEQALAQNKAEVLEVVRAQQRENPKTKPSEREMKQQIRNVENLTVSDMATGNFIKVFLLGLVLAVPAGIFLRE